MTPCETRLTLTQVAAQQGVHPKTVRRWADGVRGTQLVTQCVGGRIYTTAAEVDAFFQRCADPHRAIEQSEENLAARAAQADARIEALYATRRI